MNEALHFRPARPSDWPFVAEMTRNVWNGTDYLPFTWREWLHENSGYLMTAEMAGRPVGVLHVELQGDTVAWIEGIRVSEDLQGQGIAQAMLERALQWSREAGYPLARLSTSSGNPASNRMAEKAGMRVVARFVPMRASASFGSEDPIDVRPALASDAERVVERLVDRSQDAAAGLYTEGWTAHDVSVERVRALCAWQAVAIHLVAGSIAGACIATCAAPFQYLRLGAMAGSPASVTELAAFCRYRARAGGLSHVRSTLSLEPERTEALRAAGFERPHDSLMFVYERELG